MNSRLIVNSELCTGCRLCELWCTLTKYGEVNPWKARLRVVREEPVTPLAEEEKNRVPICVPIVCQHCKKAPCIDVCPVQALSRNPETRAVVLDEEKCISCKACAEACPFQAIFETPDGQIIKCDLCEGDPECAKHCPTRALTYGAVDIALVDARKRRAEQLAPKSLHHPAPV